MSKHQVRLDPDVAEVLVRDAERKGTSLNVAANSWLRRGLGLTPASTAPRPPVDRDRKAEAAVLKPAGAPSTASSTCPPHPANRRVGPHCLACGATFKVKPGPMP